ncbi:MAG: PQQ-dependent sugar dehydrogenase [Chitinophagaceae bacterium]|nr:PQQ-dependent sugar dehydrogenase [Chitinophagaceae bacterium]
MKFVLLRTMVIFFALINFQLSAQNEPFTTRVVNPGYQLNSAWEILYGPDDSLWVTENKAYLVSRIDPVTGNKTQLVDLNTKKNFTTSTPKWPQGGLMGMVLHPSMYSEWPNPSKPYVYIAYVYQYNASNACKNSTGPCYFNTKIVRYNYDRSTHSLSNELVITQSLNGSNDHNGGRLAIGNVGGVPYLFYSIGEMGAGQFNNSTRTNNAQNTDISEGKILRYNLEPDGDADQWDRWIPNDNPFTTLGKKNPVWSFGHRNPQGIVFGSDGTLYQSEQQDMTDDEINIIDETRNYGWPKVSGYCDGNYNGFTLAGQPIVSEQDNCNTLNVKEPIYTLFTISQPNTLSNDYLTWPTVATSGIDIYEKKVIPNWNKSLLVPSLKGGVVYRLKLSADGKSVEDIFTVPAMEYTGRFRDLAISSDGLRIYAACDMDGQSQTAKGTFGTPPNRGRILEFTYTGPVLAINDDTYNYVRNTEFWLFPNPASTKITVRSIKSSAKPLYYYMYSAAGKLTKYGKVFTDAFDIDVSIIPRGLYIIKVYDAYNKNVYTEKVTVQ